MSAALSLSPTIGNQFSIENAPGKTCGTTGVFAVTVATSTTGCTLDVTMKDVVDSSLCIIRPYDLQHRYFQTNTMTQYLFSVTESTTALKNERVCLYYFSLEFATNSV